MDGRRQSQLRQSKVASILPVLSCYSAAAAVGQSVCVRCVQQLRGEDVRPLAELARAKLHCPSVYPSCCLR